MEDSFELTDDRKKTHAFIQYKNTDICIDFRCDCGGDYHFDGYFAYVLQCPACGTNWEMPPFLFPRKASAERVKDSIPKILED